MSHQVTYRKQPDGCVRFRYEIDGQQVGYVKTSESFIYQILVDEEYRDQGIGSELVQWALEYAYDHDSEYIELVCKPKLVGYYEQFGFSVKFYTPGQVIMSHQIREVAV
jgi:ribosomal protein S18 acetylase RimI-like enzyme